MWENTKMNIIKGANSTTLSKHKREEKIGKSIYGHLKEIVWGSLDQIEPTH
jgi:hypothetical protein